MKKILLSIHDVTPFFAPEIDAVCRKLDALGATRRSLLVVPDYMRRTPLAEHACWCRDISARRETGCDISLHGIHHEYAEFGRADFEAAREKISRARQCFCDAFGFAPGGFVAPQWFQSRGCKQAVTEAGFLYAARWSGLFDGAGNCLYRAFPVNFDWGADWADGLFMLINSFRLKHKKSGVLRLSLHPMDVRHGLFEREAVLLAHLLDDGWECLSYADAAKERAVR
ncbi:MAG: DUF2334 domain-containing protein [Victivallaceae bacterium]|nr:DUF2334 domain-containing protein [Victivallaceae bacterium]